MSDYMKPSIPLTITEKGFGSPEASITDLNRGISISGSTQGCIGIGNGSAIYGDGMGRKAALTGLSNSEMSFLSHKHFGNKTWEKIL